MANTHAVVCNEAEGTPLVEAGSLCFVRQYSTAERTVLVDVLNRKGEWISAWRPFDSLTNFRTRFLPPNHVKIIFARPASASRTKVAALIAAFAAPAPETGQEAEPVDIE